MSRAGQWGRGGGGGQARRGCGSRGRPSSSIMDRATERWKFLRRAILAANCEDEGICFSSVRGFGSFDLFRVTDACAESQTGRWLNYSYTTDDADIICEASVKTLKTAFSLDAMVGFNNTGNVCVWPAEEVMARHCLEHMEMFKDTTVCELGCGMTGLAGLMLACSKSPSQVLLTDGNEASVQNVKEIVDTNRWRFEGCTSVSCEVLRWESMPLNKDNVGKFDYVVCADCLFFCNVHSELALTLLKLLKPGKGVAILFAPRRGDTLEKFCAVARKYFQVECAERYSELVWKVREQKPSNFNFDLHYPLKIVLKQKL